jgi:hypothetical protein
VPLLHTSPLVPPREVELRVSVIESMSISSSTLGGGGHLFLRLKVSDPLGIDTWRGGSSGGSSFW